jgi:hypothetical protein
MLMLLLLLLLLLLMAFRAGFRVLSAQVLW